MSKHTPGPWTINGSWPTNANARLIAAAPELLAALQEAVEWLEDDHSDDEYIVDAWYHAAVKAIAKATGDDT